MFEKNVIEFLNSFWVLLVVLVCKKDGLMCFCVDYCWLNDIIIKDVYFLLKIDEVFDYLLGYEMFFIFDLNSGYW